MTQTIQILSVWADGLNWVVETEPGTYMYVPKSNVPGVEVQSVTENGLCDDGLIYFLASYLDRTQGNAIGHSIVVDPSLDTMVRVETPAG